MFGIVRSSVGGSNTYELRADDDVARRSSSLMKDVKLLNIHTDDDKEIKITRINTYGEIPPVLEEESAVICCENCNHQRRAIVLEKDAESSWGFTLQSYGILNKETGETEIYTYIDYVDFSSAASVGGLRKGDVIIALNGKPTQGLSDEAIIDYIRSCPTNIRMVVISCDVWRRIELHTRLQKLKEVLTLKQQEVAALDSRELAILAKSVARRHRDDDCCSDSTSTITSSCSGSYSCATGNDGSNVGGVGGECTAFTAVTFL